MKPPAGMQRFALLGSFEDRRLAIALLASVVVHGVAITVAPPGKATPRVPPAVVEVRLAAPEEPAATQSMGRTDPVDEQRVRKAPRVARAATRLAAAAPPAPPRLPPREPALQPSAAVAAPALAPAADAARDFPAREDPAPPAAMSAAVPNPPAAEPMQPEVARDIASIEPAPAPTATKEISRPLSSELLETYGRRISEELGRYKEYPRIAQIRGWEGSVTMRLRVTASGRLVDAQLYSSSGHDVLDRQALAMAGKAERLPAPPDGLRDREVVVLVPIVFRLEP